jgi:hypothetical protein
VVRPRRNTASRRSAGLASNADFGFLAHMDKNTGAAQNDPRKERLAKALRDNLKRRKAQARERAANPDAEKRTGQMAERKG